MFYIIITIFGIVIIMERANINGTELEFTIEGTWKPVILIHGAIIADANYSLMMQSTLIENYQMIHYHCQATQAAVVIKPISASSSKLMIALKLCNI
jgi:hypothetical protein